MSPGSAGFATAFRAVRASRVTDDPVLGKAQGRPAGGVPLICPENLKGSAIVGRKRLPIRNATSGTPVAISGLEAGSLSRFETGGGYADRWDRRANRSRVIGRARAKQRP